jgi:3-hydroxyacyl-[acyl-carrier-protein] dehydratase
MKTLLQPDIEKIIPHRAPMLLVDKIEVIDETHTTGYCTIRGDEFYMQGHFPNNPVVPGVMLCEMMAQSASVVMDTECKNTLFVSMDGVKFKHIVRPGDTVRFEIHLTRRNAHFYFFSGRGFVGDKVCVSGDLVLACVEKN